MSGKRTAGRKEKTSPDYPQLARTMLDVSRDALASKLPAGLFIVATPIVNLGDISLRALVTLGAADHIACEDTRLSGQMLAHFGIKKKHLLSYHDHTRDDKREAILKIIENGHSVALISDAGMPLIADPGFRLGRACREAGYDVTVIPGANAALTALSGSGLPTDRFLFVGFLPPKTSARIKAIEAMAEVKATLVMYEAPQRLQACLTDLGSVLGGERQAAVGRELTKLFEETRCDTLAHLARYFQDHPARGELVIVIAPPDAGSKPGLNLASVDQLLRDEMQKLSLRDAVACVSEATGLRKSEVYARALILRGES